MEQGKCPKCGSYNLNYGYNFNCEKIVDIAPNEQAVYYPYTCDDCEFEGREYYNLTFSGFEDNDGNEITE